MKRKKGLLGEGLREKRLRVVCHYTEVHLMDPIMEPHFTEQLKQQHQELALSKTTHCCLENPIIVTDYF